MYLDIVFNHCMPFLTTPLASDLSLWILQVSFYLHNDVYVSLMFPFPVNCSLKCRLSLPLVKKTLRSRPTLLVSAL